MTGKKLGHYEVESLLGAGGMGEVYRARDLRLERSVAIKVLPAAFAEDPERVARFQREARVLASLNHPNIAALYGLEEFDGAHFLVMELVEGETLAECIARGAIPPAETLRIAHQIAEACEAAHEKGVVHRDLKPANIKITPEGKVKVLDFGLAKAMEGAPSDIVAANSPTISLAATHAGVVLGTAAYMSPEQAKGLEATPRADIFSFGCVLYEMYTGRQPFQGDTVAEVMAHVIARDPDLSALPANLNPRVPELLRRCLQKDPKRRWHAVADTRVEIEVILADPRGIIIDAELIAPRPLWKRAFPLVAGLLAGAVAGVSAVWLLRAAPAADVTQFRFPLPAGQTFTNTGRPVLTMSRDGTAFVYAGSGRLYLKKMNEFEAKAIPGSEIAGGGPINPAFDATGRSIAFFSEADKTIKRIGVDGGRPVTICRAENVFGMNWGADDSILFGGGSQGVMRVSAKGGSAESILTVKENEQARNPQLLPGGAVLFTLVSGDKTDIVAETPQGNDRKVVIEGGNDARYVPLGRLVYALAGDVLSLPFDVKKLERTDGPTPLPQTVYAGGSKDAAQWSFSDTGSLVYVSKSSTSIQTTVAFVDRDGKTQPIALPPSQYEGPRLSPNGRQLAIGGYDGAERHIWVYDLAGGSAIRQLTLEGEGPSNRFPLWAGEDRVIFQSNRTGVNKVFLQRADGSGPAERVIENSQNQRPTSFNRQNQLVAYIRILNSNRDDDLWTYAISTRKAAEFYAAPGRQQGPAFSPDGRWMVYDSNETGKTEVYVQPYPTGAKVRLTRDGGSHAVWSRDGGEIYFVNAGTLFSMKIRTQPSVTFTSPVPLPISGFVQGDEPSHRNYDFASDGRFIMVFPPGTTEVKGSGPPPQIQAVLNWFEELKQLGADR